MITRSGICCLFFVLLAAGAAQGNLYYVPDDFPTIQRAISANYVVNGDSIVVRPGNYMENIDFRGKLLWVKSEKGPAVTLINGGGGGSVAVFVNGENSGAILQGFTLTGGTGTLDGFGYHGGGVFCKGSSPWILENVFTGNSASGYGGAVACFDGAWPQISYNTIVDNDAGFGGGIGCWDSSPRIEGNTIERNSALQHGGGIISAVDSLPEIRENLIGDNSAAGSGGGICCGGAGGTITNNILTYNDANKGGGIAVDTYGPHITNNTIRRNRAIVEGGGLFVESGGTPEVTNTVLWANVAPLGDEYSVRSNLTPSTLSISYSDVRGGQASGYVESSCTLNWGAGMIDADPLFLDTPGGDFHLTWGSPCRDTGDNGAPSLPSHDFEYDPRTVLGTVDIGHDEYNFHLYCKGSIQPGNPIDIKAVGAPSMPVVLFFDPDRAIQPVPTQHGFFFLPWPVAWQGVIGTIPNDGILVYSVTVPSGWSTAEDYFIQALVGPWGGGQSVFTNLSILVVE
jgi:hypothetical protein